MASVMLRASFAVSTKHANVSIAFYFSFLKMHSLFAQGAQISLQFLCPVDSSKCL